ncbi:DNA polymerase I [Trichlorobacter ammonificans]|uniref:DNA polymerase I n=1 Tax=Trichlorobacter ammonificans TaxID=2916410 RepID=A0ABM9D9C2_9BACT|nr:DNA polymerase I [Trichlorobacter ammonificans]CAH2031819.1 DNA polymerase I [Trichlorobacter ammonificans]
MNTTLYLIDGSSYLYRAYFAIKRLSSPSGFPTNAIYGFTQMLLKLLKDYKPEHLAMVFDVGRVTFRTELYPAYKANREEMPADLRQQLEPIRDLVRAFNIPVVELAGYEADDLIGTLAARWEASGGTVVVVTGDKDLMQIVTGRTTLLDTMKNTASDIPQVQERFGVGPEKVIDILGLAGDSSDNIPGVPGIGEKTAIKLIQQFGSLDALLERAAEVPGKTGEKLREFAEQARLSRRLATIVRDVPYDLNPEELAAREPDTARLHELFSEYGFFSLIKELTARATLQSDRYHCVQTPEQLERLVTRLEEAPAFAFDTETTGLDPRTASLVGISIALEPHEAFYIPVGHRSPLPASPPPGEGDLFAFSEQRNDDADSSPQRGEVGRGGGLSPGQLSRDLVLDRLRPVFGNPSVRKVGQNLKFDLQVLDTAGIEVQGSWCDTMLCSYLLNPSRGGHGLDALAQEHLNHRMISYDEVTGTGRNRINFSEVGLEEATRYACEDADVTWLIHEKLLPMVREAGQEELLFGLEMPLMAILTRMERYGVLLDREFLGRLSEDFGSQMARLETQIHELAGGPFNLNSPKQLGEVLFEKLGLATAKKTKGKTGWSTDNEVLTSLAEEHEIPRLLLEYRGLAKLKSTYADALVRLADDSGRVHTSYNQAVTSTGRLSSSDPNLQNIPIRTEEGRRIREAFIAPAGSVILAADYSQVELRVLAHLSSDPVFCQAFGNDEDIHTRTASEIFGLFPEMVTSEMRRQAKTINFGVIYGQGAFSLAKQLGVARNVAEKFIAAYKERHSGAMGFLDRCVQQAREQGYVTTILGRKLPIADIASANHNLRSFAERNAINYPIQGSAADIIKQAMLGVERAIAAEGLQSRLIMQVHDELVFEVPEGELAAMKVLVEREMSQAVPLQVPLKVDMNFGKNWSEAH